MPRAPRISAGGVVYHVMNRANGRATIFRTDADYAGFETVLADAHEHMPMRTLSYCIMPNHWHLVLWPMEDGDLSEFMRWLTLAHVQRWKIAHGAVGFGHLYQGRFKSFPVESDAHFLTVCRYVERNPLRAGLVRRAEEWRWGSLWHRLRKGSSVPPVPLARWPVLVPDHWLSWLNGDESESELKSIRLSVTTGRPFGSAGWVRDTAARLGLESTLRSRGRPRKEKVSGTFFGLCGFGEKST